MRSLLLLPAAFLLLATTTSLVACGGGTVEPDPIDPGNSSGGASSSGGGSSSGDINGFSTEQPPYGQRLGELPEDNFTFIKPAGETICSLGTEYGFAVRRGDPNKIVVEFEGGGACWNAGTCDNPYSESATPIYKDIVNAAQYTGTQVGLRADNDANPVKGWTHIVVPYCSADIHWGDKESTYGDRTVQHRGVKNTKAVLDYVYSQIKAPERILVTGCSAGGYGSVYWTPEVRAHYANSKVKHFSDSAAGVIAPTYFETLQNAWNFTANVRSEMGDVAQFTSLKFLYGGIARNWPDVPTSQYNALSDTTQATFYSVMGGSGWQASMLSNMSELLNDVPTFNTYLSDGNVHCQIDKNDMYGKEIGGTKLTDWLGKIVNDQPVENVACPTCKLPE